MVACAFAGCASIHITQTTTDTPLKPSIKHKVVEDSVVYSVSKRVRGYEIIVEIEQQETCATLSTPRAHRLRYVDRRVDTTASKATWLLAAATFGAGAYGYLDAGTLAAQSNAPDSPSAEQYRQYGGGLMFVGLLAATVGFIDGVRAGNSEYDDGIIKRQTTRVESACHYRTSGNRDLELVLVDGHRLPGWSDSRGSATFSLLGIPDEGLPSNSETAQLLIGGERLRVSLSDAQSQSIRSSLLAEPTSRLAVDNLQKQREACASAVASSRAWVAPEPADVPATVLRPWQSAKTECGNAWTPSFEDELLVVEHRIAATECRSRFRVAGDAFTAESEITVQEMADELATLRERCTTVEDVAKLKELDGKLAASIRRSQKEAASIRRAVARDEARAAAAFRTAQERARSQRSLPDLEPTWYTPSSSRSCCRVCSAGKACGNSCISRAKQCHRGTGCACDG